MRILLTAFEPFGGEDTNAALEAVQRVSAPTGVELERCTASGVAAEAMNRTLISPAPASGKAVLSQSLAISASATPMP